MQYIQIFKNQFQFDELECSLKFYILRKETHFSWYKRLFEMSRDCQKHYFPELNFKQFETSNQQKMFTRTTCLINMFSRRENDAAYFRFHT